MKRVFFATRTERYSAVALAALFMVLAVLDIAGWMR